MERGTDATRLVVPGPDGRPEPVAVLPAGTPVATAVHELVGSAHGPVAVLHPPDGELPPVEPAPDRVVAPEPVPDRGVRPVPAPVAVLAGRPGRFLVVDAGRSGTTLTVVDDGCVRSTVRVPVGGDRLDAVLATATGCPDDRVRRVREALSCAEQIEVPGYGLLDAATVDAVLGPELDDVVAHAPSMAAGVEEVLLAGGLARTPLLAEMLDERVDRPVRVLPEPDLAGVRGALALLFSDTEPAHAGPAMSVPGTRSDAGPAGVDAGTAVDRDGASGRGRAFRGRLFPAAVVLGVLLVGTGTVLGAADGPPAPPPGTLVQYGYAFALPSGWEHTGGDSRRRRTLLTRAASPDGVELISVERSPLGYDSAAEPDRARAELAAVHRAAPGLSELLPDTVAGRAVTRYRQQAGPDAVVDWFVLFDATDELVVGCRRPARWPAPETERACADVLGSARVRD